MDKGKQSRALPHGGDWAGFEIEYGEKPLDFSMNVNPLGIPAGVCDAITKAATDADRYPDPLCRELRTALSDAENTPADWIFCGNGAADIIFRLAKALKVNAKANIETPILLITAPTFSEYETAFAAEEWEIRRHLLHEENGFRLDESILDEIGEKDNTKAGTHVLFLCEPNNPTGVTTDPALLRSVLERCQETGTILVIDECFNGFLDDPAAHSMKGSLSGYDNLVILKAFTKLYGMAGVRLGYCLCSNPAIIEQLQQAGPPWNVSSLAQAAGIAALQDAEHTARGRAIVQEERPWLINELHRLGITQVYGEANYLLFRWNEDQADTLGEAQVDEASVRGAPLDKASIGEAQPDKTSVRDASLHEALRSRGILIRDCSNYRGLCKGWYRIAVRTHEENLRLVKALKRI